LPERAQDGAGQLEGLQVQAPYYVMARDTSGATRKSARVQDGRVADKMLREKQVEIDKRHAGYREQRDIAFADWVDEYEAIRAGRSGSKGSTRRAYADTLKVARDAIGYVSVREIGNRELRKFHERVKHTAESTQIKHQRLRGEIRIRHTYDGVDGLTAPKDRDARERSAGWRALPPGDAVGRRSSRGHARVGFSVSVHARHG
jgi:hypothetical protein